MVREPYDAHARIDGNIHGELGVLTIDRFPPTEILIVDAALSAPTVPP